MKITLICVGKLSLDFIRQGVAEYEKRLKRYTTLQIIELKEEKRGGKKADINFIRTSEAQRISAKIPAGAHTIVLDETGVALGSEKFAANIERQLSSSCTNLCFIIGGAYGLTDELKSQCSELLSLSAMTFTHQMARLFLMEQIYRGFTIIRREPYHNS
ncbi:MAG: 23S rRNA (pseudouridine(1915)-N(3))-methyltransferase RlmH [Desulfuromonas sp.]|nr:23S rRNA (pseudouridine(1915)-N(3))-methyltransferase RlmH [Desulfuromonas sp.]